MLILTRVHSSDCALARECLNPELAYSLIGGCHRLTSSRTFEGDLGDSIGKTTIMLFGGSDSTTTPRDSLPGRMKTPSKRSCVRRSSSWRLYGSSRLSTTSG